MIEISRNYNTPIKVTQLQLTRQQFYSITDQHRFNLLYDTIGGAEWGSIYDGLGLTVLFGSLLLILVFGIVII